jgi:hypothetical protein
VRAAKGVWGATAQRRRHQPPIGQPGRWHLRSPLPRPGAGKRGRPRPAAGRCGTGRGASGSVKRRSAWRNRWRRRQSPETAPARRAHPPTRERCATTWHAPSRRSPIAHSSASRRAEGVRGSPAAELGHGYSLRASDATGAVPDHPAGAPTLCQTRGRGMPGNAAQCGP